MPHKINLTKQELRQGCKSTRASLTAEIRRHASEAICQHIQDWEIFRNTSVILTYMPMRSEVDLTPLLARHPNKRWAIPRIVPGNQMIFCGYDPSRLIRHAYGILEPAPDCPIISPAEIQLVLAPGLAFDCYGWRLGYGRGFYDRFLSRHTSIAAGITYQALLLESVPHADYDIPMQFVITEAGIRDIR
ncbi:MAG: 5-formyltetrahydrofolate cyclo-ligase [Chloroflexota bacterium]